MAGRDGWVADAARAKFGRARFWWDGQTERSNGRVDRSSMGLSSGFEVGRDGWNVKFAGRELTTGKWCRR